MHRLFDIAREIVRTWLERHQYWVIFLLIFASAVPIAFVFDSPIHGDVVLYHRIGQELSEGVVPYRDRELEYPPYAIPIFLAPRLFGSTLPAYQFGFLAIVALADSLLKCLLLFQGLRERDRFCGLLPLLLYSVSVPFISYFYFQRYDAFPALLTLASLLCFARRGFGCAGAILVIAGGVKLYPVLLGPALFVGALRHNAGARFAAGAAAASVPLLILSFILPWWRFLAFHGERGLQVESVYASVIWLAHLLGQVEAGWTPVKAWTEVTGSQAHAVLPWAKLIMLSATFASVIFAVYVMARNTVPNVYQLARLMLVPLLAFVAFNIVLSPQYLIWLLPMAALGLLGKNRWPMVMVAIATMVTPVFYPSQHYGTGLPLGPTLVLLFRNVTLIVVWLALIAEFWRIAKNSYDSVAEVSASSIPTNIHPAK